MDEVPCGTKFSNCKFIKDAHRASTSIVDLKEQVRKLHEEKNDKQNRVKKVATLRTVFWPIKFYSISSENWK